MKKFLLLLLAFLSLTICAAGDFNVRDFGARGDGRTDDTAAIQSAIDAAKKKCRYRRHHGKHPPSSYFGSGVTVTFPPGFYKITRTIDVPSLVSLAGTGGTPLLEWHGPESDKGIMFKIAPSRFTAENLVFSGGGTHLLFSNKNLDKTMLTIRNCRFFYAGEIAIKMVPHPDVDHMSVLATIANCLFAKNYRCVENCGDMMVIRDCWVELSQPQLCDGAAFINRYGTLKMEFCCLVPCANPDKGPDYYHNARWVDNYARFEADSVRFGGEGGGIPAVYNYAGLPTHYPWSNGGGVSIKNSVLCVGQNKRENGTVVRLFALPMQLLIADNNRLSNKPLLVCDPSLDIEKELSRSKRAVPNISWKISNNGIGSQTNARIPEELKRFFTPEKDLFGKVPVTPVPAEITRGKK